MSAWSSNDPFTVFTPHSVHHTAACPALQGSPPERAAQGLQHDLLVLLASIGTRAAQKFLAKAEVHDAMQHWNSLHLMTFLQQEWHNGTNASRNSTACDDHCPSLL